MCPNSFNVMRACYILKSVSIITILLFLQAQKSHAANHALKLEIAPYLWDLNMSGRVNVSTSSAHIDKSRPGGMLWMKLSKDKFGLFATGIYNQMSGNKQSGPISVHVVNKFGIFSGGIDYVLLQWQLSHANEDALIKFVPYAGFRYTLKNTDATISLWGFSTSLTHHENWTDPFIGLRLNYNITRAWQILLSGDIGGTNRTTDYSYNTIVQLGYGSQFSLSKISAYVGYQILKQHYSHGQNLNYFAWDMKLAGPLIGISITI